MEMSGYYTVDKLIFTPCILPNTQFIKKMKIPGSC